MISIIFHQFFAWDGVMTLFPLIIWVCPHLCWFTWVVLLLNCYSVWIRPFQALDLTFTTVLTLKVSVLTSNKCIHTNYALRDWGNHQSRYIAPLDPWWNSLGPELHLSSGLCSLHFNKGVWCCFCTSSISINSSNSLWNFWAFSFPQRTCG